MGWRWVGLAILLLPQDPAAWVEFDSAETERPPKLVVDGKDHPATADTVLISYLADRAFPRLEGLAVSLGDTNRALIRFALEGVDAPKKVELVLSLKLPAKAPTEAFELGVYAVTGEWDEGATWNRQPAFDKEGVTATIQPKAGEVRIDVTPLVRKGLKHGVLLKAAKAIGSSGDTDRARDVERRLRSLLTWESTVAKARERAGRDRLVLAVVLAEDHPTQLPIAEAMLLAAGLAHPEVRDLIAARYVPVRIVVDPHVFPDGRIDGLGLPARDAKPPALVVTDAEGRKLASLASLGTFDAESFLEFLRSPLKDPPKRAPRPRGAELFRQGRLIDAREVLAAADDPQSRYLLGCLDWRERRPDEARASWETVVEKHADSPWALKAAARLAWPERLAIYETLVEPEAMGATTESPAKDAARAVERAADYLLAQQLADGSWPLPEAEHMYRAAVTALAANALFAWRESLGGVRKERVRAALDRATTWIRGYLAKAAPASANSWGTTYLLDYLLDRHAADPEFRGDVEKAVALHLGGQLPNGAWSYDRTFGTSWRGGFSGWPKTDRGRAHSMNTGPALVALTRAKTAGFKVDGAALKKGVEALKAMRKEAGVYTYTWPDPESFAKLDQSIGRASGCELALRLLGAAEEGDADVAIDAFMKHRADLRIPAKLTGGWMPPRATSGYFYVVAYYDAARLIAACGGDGAAAKLRLLREDLLAVVEVDGTWVDFHPTGKPYATAMAMLVMRPAK